jgi:hypothetical protein
LLNLHYLNLKEKLFLLFTVILFACLRLYFANYHGLWVDEQLTFILANGFPFSSLPEGLIENKILTHSPALYKTNVIQASVVVSGGNAAFYNVVLSYWIQLFGDTNIAIRFISISLSIVFPFLLLYFLNLFELNTSDKKKLSLLVILLTFSFPLLNRYAFENRAYMLGLFFVTLSLILYYKISESKNRSLYLSLLFGLLCFLSFITHYLTLFIFLILCLHCVLFNRKSLLKFIPGMLSFAVLTLIFVHFTNLIDGLKLLSTRASNFKEMAWSNPENGWIQPMNLYYTIASLVQSILYSTGNFLQHFDIQIRYLFWWIPLAIIILYYFYQSNVIPFFLKSLLLTGVICYPLICLTLSLKAGHNLAFQHHYLIYYLPFFLLMLSIGFIEMFKAKAWLFYIALFVYLATTSVGNFSFFTNDKILNNSFFTKELRQIAKSDSRLNKNDTIVFNEDIFALLYVAYVNNAKELEVIQVDTNHTENFTIIKSNL